MPGEGRPRDDEKLTDDLRTWLDHARWLYEDQRFRFDALGRQATSVLAMSGVLLGLLAAAGGSAHRPNGPQQVSLLVGGLSAVFAAGKAVWALRPFRTASISITDVADWWKDAAVRAGQGQATPTADVAHQTESLLRSGAVNSELGASPITGYKQNADTRAKAVLCSTIALAVAIAAIGVYVAIGAFKWLIAVEGVVAV